MQSWRANWAGLSTYFKYPAEVRKIIYTTNAIEGFNRQLHKVTKSKSVVECQMKFATRCAHIAPPRGLL